VLPAHAVREATPYLIDRQSRVVGMVLQTYARGQVVCVVQAAGEVEFSHLDLDRGPADGQAGTLDQLVLPMVTLRRGPGAPESVVVRVWPTSGTASYVRTLTADAHWRVPRGSRLRVEADAYLPLARRVLSSEDGVLGWPTKSLQLELRDQAGRPIDGVILVEGAVFSLRAGVAFMHGLEERSYQLIVGAKGLRSEALSVDVGGAGALRCPVLLLPR
jgi:hypothetical protein